MTSGGKWGILEAETLRILSGGDFMLAAISLLLNIVLLVMFFIMFFAVLSMRETLERLAAHILPSKREAVATEDGGEIFQGYRIPPEVLRTVREYMAAGVETKAETELARGAHMPRSVARIYLRQM